ncbi:MAG: DUF3027 domain-containing protein [Candidatus Ancillula sp.]|jgi:hypothetical protein|nr:DUF3027 domain-containing protein [Candidatus Ancillula sp.]
MFKFFKAFLPKKKTEKEKNEIKQVKEVKNKNLSKTKKEPKVKELKLEKKNKGPKKSKFDSRRKLPEKILSVEAEEIAKNAAALTAENVRYVGNLIEKKVIDGATISFEFASKFKAYPDWKFVVILQQLNDEDEITITESTFQPRENAFIAPEWIPWKERLQPSDMSEIDYNEFQQDDENLDLILEDLNKEEQTKLNNLAVEKNRILNVLGRSETAARWYEGVHGPKTASTRIALANCQTCGFYLPLEGDIGQMFGVCANAWSRDDGRVVSADHGCGMHSETDLPKKEGRWKPKKLRIDNSESFENILEETK